MLVLTPVAPPPVFSPGVERAYFSGWRRTMYILGMNRQHRVTVADRITHMHRLEIWIWKHCEKIVKAF